MPQAAQGLGQQAQRNQCHRPQAITELYAGFTPGDKVKIFRNSKFIYREYTVMQPLQRSYGITPERIDNLVAQNVLSGLYDAAKVAEWQNAEELSAKDQKKLDAMVANEEQYNAIISALQAAATDQLYPSPDLFRPVLEAALQDVTADKKLIDKIMDGLSAMDKTATIQRDKKGHILYDKDTKDTELVNIEEDIDTYMAREVLPHIPDAKAFFEEDLTKKKPVIKTGAEIPFTRYFYTYEQPEPSDALAQKFVTLEQSVNDRIRKLFE